MIGSVNNTADAEYTASLLQEQCSEKRTGAVVVAAGLSSRMKWFKPMLPYFPPNSGEGDFPHSLPNISKGDVPHFQQGKSTIAIHIVTMLKELGIAPIVVVTGFRAEELEDHLSDKGVRFVRNERYRETEMFDSIMLGVGAIANDCERIMLMPMDTPAIKKETMRQVLMIDEPLIRTMCNGHPGHPVLIAKSLIPMLSANDGRRGLRGAIEDSGVVITNLEVEDEGIYKDIDTQEDYHDLVFCSLKGM